MNKEFFHKWLHLPSTDFFFDYFYNYEVGEIYHIQLKIISTWIKKYIYTTLITCVFWTINKKRADHGTSIRWYCNTPCAQMGPPSWNPSMSEKLSSLDPIYLSLLHPHKILDNFSDMDGFQDGGYVWAQGVLQYYLIEVPCSWRIKNQQFPLNRQCKYRARLKYNKKYSKYVTTKISK